MTTTACAEDWREMYDKAAREAREWRENFNVLQRALVGETGASGIEVAHTLRKHAERYRTMLANFETLVLRTENGSTLTLKAEKRGEQFTRRGTDATLDGLGAA